MTEKKGFRRIGNEFTARSAADVSRDEGLLSVVSQALPLFGPKWDIHLPVFLTAPTLARLLWLDTVYQKAIDVPGQIVEFGSQWGASLNALLLLKMIREPWNAGRVINSFSNFSDGFPAVTDKDGAVVREKDLAVAEGWDATLQSILDGHAAKSPLGGAGETRIYNGDATQTFPAWLADNPEALISLAHFDMDLYAPTRDVLKLCLPRMPKGAVLVFDELNCPSMPGETVAVQEVLGIHGLALRKTMFQPYSAYCVIE